MSSEILRLHLEPEQERLVSPLLREATLTGKGVLAQIQRTPGGVQLALATFDRGTWLKLRKVIDAASEKEALTAKP